MDKVPLTFLPNDKESMYIESNGISWSKWCHSHLEDDMKYKKLNIIYDMQIPVLMIVLSVLLYVIAIQSLLSPLLMSFCFVASIFCLSFGLLSILWSVYNERKHKRLYDDNR